MNKFQKGFVALTIVLVIVTLAALGAASWFWYQSTQDAEVTSVNSFEECVAAGYAIGESHPRQCFVPGGQSFTEKAEDPDTQQTEVDEYVEYSSQKGEVVRLKTPRANYVIGSPLVVEGQVKGNWSFEADFPVELADESKEQIVKQHATLQGDWMTEEYVHFKATLIFKQPGDLSKGFLILRKSNPSGLAENDDFVEIPVSF
jgi:hypothetical protein